MSDVKVNYPHRERLISKLHEAADLVVTSPHDVFDVVVSELKTAADAFREAELAFAHGVQAARTPVLETPPKTNTTLTRAA